MVEHADRPSTVAEEPRRLDPAMAALLWLAGVLVFLAGVQLFVFSERTDRYFAWTIQPHLTAAFLGAAYWSAAVFEWTAARARAWADARVTVPTVFTFTVLTLVATLLHLDKFHFGGSFEIGTQLVTWAWLAIYTSVPVMMLVLWFRQARAPGVDPPRRRPLPAWVRGVVSVQAALFLVVGAGLFVAPGSTSEWWPWPLTPLTSRAVGAWVFSLGIAAAHAVVEGDARRVRPAAGAYLSFAVLEAVAVLRYPDDADWGSTAGVVYLVTLATSALIGAGVLWLGRGDRDPALAGGRPSSGPGSATRGG